jgi:hypothetical protein
LSALYVEKNSTQMKGEYSILKKMPMEVCMILPHLRKERTLDDFNNTQENYFLKGYNAKDEVVKSSEH